ncbi:PREDICTED: uncharacterized protein LOC106110115, partial [Papilio polytes]|uniref:uncharacterized protein LOC106110115 n=1 Tax=Papilio polytes TaxID=76194 RepID=UPI0006766552
STHIQNSGNFAKCNTRFDGLKTSDVLAFIDAIEIYKTCVNMSDDVALRGLPMLLTGLAATWWQGVKNSTPSWQAALESLRQTFGPRLPAHKIFRLIFEREQQINETTDLFICHIRALFAQLPPHSLSEDVQLEMTYGLLHKRIREKVPRSCFTSFAELIAQARRIEDILNESRPLQTKSDVKPTLSTLPSNNTQPCYTPSPVHNKRPQCSYCKRYGHVKEACQKLAGKPLEVKEGVLEKKTPAVTCFGCGTPGRIRSNCPTCKEKKSLEPVTSSFQSVSA